MSSTSTAFASFDRRRDSLGDVKATDLLEKLLWKM
jgi:hypothetical protein